MATITLGMEYVAINVLQVLLSTCTTHESQSLASLSSANSNLLSLNCIHMWLSCFPGFRLANVCYASNQRSNCTPCPPSQYIEQMNFSPNCRSCKVCRGRVRFTSVLLIFFSVFYMTDKNSDNILFTFSPFSYFFQIKSMKYRCLNVKDTETLFVVVRTVITNPTLTQKLMSVANAQNVELMRKNKINVSQCEKQLKSFSLSKIFCSKLCP